MFIRVQDDVAVVDLSHRASDLLCRRQRRFRAVETVKFLNSRKGNIKSPVGNARHLEAAADELEQLFIHLHRLNTGIAIDGTGLRTFIPGGDQALDPADFPDSCIDGLTGQDRVLVDGSEFEATAHELDRLVESLRLRKSGGGKAPEQHQKAEVSHCVTCALRYST